MPLITVKVFEDELTQQQTPTSPEESLRLSSHSSGSGCARRRGCWLKKARAERVGSVGGHSVFQSFGHTGRPNSGR